MLAVSVPSVQATVYSAHAEDWTGNWDVWLTVDTSADTLTVKWNAEDWGLKYWYLGGSYIHVWDDLSQIYWVDAPPLYHIPSDGEKTFSYSLTHINVYAEVRWCYSITLFMGFAVTVRCDLYVPPEGSGCPTLFLWNGTAYAEEGVLHIHAESDVTVCHEIQNTLALEKGVYKLQLRGLDEYTSHIDQVKLYAVDYEGEWHMCPLIYAYHNELGKVTLKLSFDDSNRVDLKTAEIIDLKFTPSILYGETAHFIFEINGYNMKEP